MKKDTVHFYEGKEFIPTEISSAPYTDSFISFSQPIITSPPVMPPRNIALEVLVDIFPMLILFVIVIINQINKVKLNDE